MKIGFQLKLSLIFIALMIFMLSASTFFEYQKAVIQQKEELRSKILSWAKAASCFIDAEKHSQISPSIQSQGSDSYKEVRGVLKKIVDIDPLIDSVYTMVKTNKENIWMFVVDSGDRKAQIAHCGERYDISGMPEMQLAFQKASVDKKMTVDKWGTWLSGYAPIYNRKGESVAIVGLDVSANSIHDMQVLLAKRFTGFLIFGSIISLVLGWLVARGITNPLRQLMLGVREARRGNFERKVVIRSRDEIEEFSVAFNKMMDGLKEAQEKLQRHYLNTIQSLAQALEAKDHYTRGHSERVMQYAVDIGKRLNFSNEELKLMADVCILHDIGKIGIPEKILTKSSSLSEEEWHVIKKHPIIGEEILKNIEFLKPGLSIVRQHHERPDGKGYPGALTLKDISRLANVVAVADAYDAMTSDRSYRKAFSKEKAIEILRENKGSQFDSQVVEVFVDYLK